MMVTEDRVRADITEMYFPPPIDDLSVPKIVLIFGQREMMWRIPSVQARDAVISRAIAQVTEYANDLLRLAGDQEVTVEAIRSEIKHTEFWEYHTDPDCYEDCGDFRPERHCSVVTAYGAADAMAHIDANTSDDALVTQALTFLAETLNTRTLPWARRLSS